MMTTILTGLGVISFLYGITIMLVGSGTLFWTIWEFAAAFFLVWAMLLRKGFFMAHPKFKAAFAAVLVIGIAVLSVLGVLIGSEFNSKGKDKLDYVIVLGAQVKESGPSVALRHRLDTATKYLEENPETICIVSGGQGSNEPISEAQCMADYLISKGIDEKRIIKEDKSTSTIENILFSRELIEKDAETIGIVSNNFHMYRATNLAKKHLNGEVYGIAAPSNIYYFPNNCLRECCGILKDKIFGNF